MAETQSDEFDFEAALAELETLVGMLEKGDLPLEQALEQFERGIRLTRDCQKALKSAEQRVEVLLRDASGEARTEPYDGSD